MSVRPQIEPMRLGGWVSAGRSAAADRVRVWGGRGKGGSVFVTFYIIINLFKYAHQKFYFIKY